MQNIILEISKIFGTLMKICYAWIGNYGMTVVVFTIFTKVVLFPISLLTQKNSIKMAQMRPKLDEIKEKYIDDKDRYIDSQLELYKEMHYRPLLDLIPLMCQIIIVLGLVGTIYRPLSYILGVSIENINTLRQWIETLGVVCSDNSYQMEIVKQIQLTGENVPQISQECINNIQQFNLAFLGIDLSSIPSFNGDYNLLWIPFLSGVSAWLMCLIQNRTNVLQLYASKYNKIGMTLFMIAFSVYFSFLVPGGVGLYWICGNLFSIPVMYLVNWIIPPRKYIDMNYTKVIQKTQKEKERFYRKYARLERRDYKRFQAMKDKHLVFYSEGKGFLKYYEPMIDYIVDNSQYIIDYVTSDPEDSVFEKSDRIRKYYVAQDKYLIPLFMKLDCDICVMTMPDLEKYHIKRSKVRKDIEYIYVCHGVGSNALTLRKGALDYYDTVFCVGIDSVREIRQMEELYNTPKKILVETGYVLLDDMIESYQKRPHICNARRTILIAPSWQPHNIIDLCVEDILDQLKNTEYDVIVRPHPQQVRHEKERFDEMIVRYRDIDNITIQTDFSSNLTVMDADLLITDWSDISYEYAFTTLRPVLFIDTPMKIMNPEYDKIEQIPITISLRKIIGTCIACNEMENILEKITMMFDEEKNYSEVIRAARDEHVFNIGKSKILSGRYIIKSLQKKIQG